MTITDHGIPVIASRQWTTALSPNASSDGWNYIVASFDGAVGAPVEWVVVSDLTTSPSQAIYNGPTHIYPNSNIQEFNQIRAGNGRIFFPLFGPSSAYYDPTDEQVHQLGTIVEDPPVDPNSSQTFYSASFDVGGLLYFGSQESFNRPSCIVVTDPVTLAQTIIGYVGNNATGYTTYGYRLAPDTATASKWIYVAYGEAPWQLWALHITTGIATKLAEVPATGNVQFQDIIGQGWTAILDTDLGQPDNVRTQLWCLDGATYAYTPGHPPPVTARNVTPASNPLTSPPELDITGGIGVIGWRNGSSGPYTYVNYTVNYANPVTIESLIASSPNNGIVGNAQQYSGFFQYFEPGDTHVWYGAWATNGVSEGPRLNVGGTIYIAGYPNGVLFSYNATADWDSNDDINPLLIGYYGLGGTQFAGIKYADYLAWTSLAGASGRLFCAGQRERNGTGSGIGSWDKATGAFAGIYTATGMDTVLPTGMVVLDGISRVAMATSLLFPPGSAPLFLFDYDMNYVGQVTPLAGVTSLGSIYRASTPNVITGIVQGSGNSLGLYQYNVQTSTLVTYVELPIFGTLGAVCQQPGGTVWIMSGATLVSVDINALTAATHDDLTSIAPVQQMAFASDGNTLFLAAGSPSGVIGAQLFSVLTGASIAASPAVGIGTIYPATLITDGDITLVADTAVGTGDIFPVFFELERAAPRIGADVIILVNGEAGVLSRCQPVYSNSNGAVRLARANGTGISKVIGVVFSGSIAIGDAGEVALDGVVVASAAEWDAVAGTTGGLVFNVLYYLSPLTPGRLTATAPTASGAEIVPVLRGLSPTQAVLVIAPPIPL